jgi:hypothetical protein
MLSSERYRHFTRKLKKIVTKTELHTYLLELAGKDTGFNVDALPSKAWLIDCIYSLKTDHHIFDSIKEAILREIPKG